jgi:hypothetical protein
MGRFFKGSVYGGIITCACGKGTSARCYFGDGGPHGVCFDCGNVQLVQFADGSTSSHVVCKRCQANHRSEIWETSVYDALREN